MTNYKVIIPSEDVVELSEIRSYLKLSASDEAQDKLLLLFARAATRLIESYIGLALLEQTIGVTTDDLFAPWSVPLGDVVSITAAYTIDQYGSKTDLDPATTFAVQSDGTFTLHSDKSLPSDARQLYYAYVGYAFGSVDEVPSEIKIAILRQTAWMHDHRDDSEAVQILGPGVKQLVESYKRDWL